MTGTLARLTLFAVALVLTIGCSSIPSISGGKRAQALDASVETYRKTIRWGYYDEASRYLRTRDGTEALADVERVSRYRVTRFEISDQLMADTGKEARVIAHIEYYDIDSGVIKTLRDDQYWWFDDESQRWFLGSALPAFGLE